MLEVAPCPIDNSHALASVALPEPTPPPPARPATAPCCVLCICLSAFPRSSSRGANVVITIIMCARSLSIMQREEGQVERRAPAVLRPLPPTPLLFTDVCLAFRQLSCTWGPAAPPPPRPQPTYRSRGEGEGKEKKRRKAGKAIFNIKEEDGGG